MATKRGTPRAQQPELRLRITLVEPPAGVAFAMQRGRFELADAVEARKDALVFEFPVNVADASCEPPRLVGEFTQGPASGRFVYINVGTSAGQRGSPWTRRIKVPLYSMTPAKTCGKSRAVSDAVHIAPNACPAIAERSYRALAATQARQLRMSLPVHGLARPMRWLLSGH